MEFVSIPLYLQPFLKNSKKYFLLMRVKVTIVQFSFLFLSLFAYLVISLLFSFFRPFGDFAWCHSFLYIITDGTCPYIMQIVGYLITISHKITMVAVVLQEFCVTMVTVALQGVCVTMVTFVLQGACVTIAALVQYFLMAAFCWMLIEGIYLYLFVVKVYNVSSKMKICHGASWGKFISWKKLIASQTTHL